MGYYGVDRTGGLDARTKSNKKDGEGHSPPQRSHPLSPPLPPPFSPSNRKVVSHSPRKSWSDDPHSSSLPAYGLDVLSQLYCPSADQLPRRLDAANARMLFPNDHLPSLTPIQPEGPTLERISCLGRSEEMESQDQAWRGGS